MCMEFSHYPFKRCSFMWYPNTKKWVLLMEFLFILFFFLGKTSKVQCISFGYQNCVMWQFNATSQMVNNIFWIECNLLWCLAISNQQQSTMGSHVTIGPSIQPLHVSWCQVSHWTFLCPVRLIMLKRSCNKSWSKDHVWLKFAYATEKIIIVPANQ